MWRSVVAVVAGYLGWWIIGILGFLSMRALWHDYASVEASMAFSTGMQIARLLVALLCSLGAGIIVTLIVRRRSALAWVLGAILTVQFLPIHYQLWSKFPIWYHVFFLLTIAPTIMLGSRWARGWSSQPDLSARIESVGQAQ